MIIVAPGSASPFYAFQQSDVVGRAIVLLLIAASIVAWSIVVDKLLQLRQAARDDGRVRRRFDDHRSVADFLLATSDLAGPMARVAGSGLDCLARLRRSGREALLNAIRAGEDLCLRDAEVDELRVALAAAVGREVGAFEARLGLLATIVSSSPFMGLLGTVWGVMMAFTGMASSGKADINILAPGVSGALLTTVVGLLVAIPALVGFNLLANNVKRLTLEADLFADELLGRIRTRYARHDRAEGDHGTLP